MDDFAKAMIQLSEEIRHKHTPEEISLGQAYGVHVCTVCGSKVGYHVNVYGKHVAVFCENHKCGVAGFVDFQEKEGQHE